MNFCDNRLYKLSNRARTVFYLILVTISLCIFVTPNDVLAQLDQGQMSEKSYVVENVRIDVTADNAVEAREQAFEVAQVKAYEKLAARFLDADELKEFSTPSLSKISNLVQDFEVTNEKLSAVRYSGTYKISFRPHSLGAKKTPAIQAERNLTPTVAKSKTLVFPVIQKDGNDFIWADGPYRKAWLNIAQKNPNILIPIGDAQDRSAIRDHEALSYNYTQLERLINRYEADQAFMALSNPQSTQNGAPAVQVQLYEAKSSGPMFVRQMMVPIYSGEMPDALFARVANQTKMALEPLMAKASKPTQSATPLKQNRPLTGPENTMTAQLNFVTMRDWVELKRNIEKTRGISSLSVKSMSAQNAIVDIQYRGDLTALAQNFRQQKLMLQSPIQNTPYGRAPIYQLTKLR